MVFNNWIYPIISKDKVDFISNEYNLDPKISNILVSRGLDSGHAIEPLISLEDISIESPFNLVDMDKAVSRINKGIDKFEKIVIYGDYDCDGVTSTSMLYLYLESVGANVSYYIPKRSGEGYGLNCEAIRELKESGADLIITVDNGISAIEEADYAAQIGVDLIITDHHQVGERLPNALAIVNPHRNDCKSEFKFLCGAGVAFKLICALESCDYETVLDNFGDILAIGTIGDIVPLIGENRYFVKRGLELLTNTNNIGLQALLKTIKLDDRSYISSENVSFMIVPRINAAGRMLEAKLGVQLLTCDDLDTSLEISKKMDALNLERKDKEKSILDSIREKIEQDNSILNNRVLVFWGENWEHGVIGIVCSKLVEEYGKPVIVLAVNDNEAVGSARSLGEFSLYNALDYCKGLLLRFGGHKLAAGMTLLPSEIDKFTLKINEYARMICEKMPSFGYEIDMELKSQDINLESVRDFSLLEPFGCDNPKPTFLTKNVRIESISSLSGDKHLKLKFSSNNRSFYALKFNISSKDFFYKIGDVVDIIYNMDVNEYNGNTSLSVFIKDIRIPNFNQLVFFKYRDNYFNFKEGSIKNTEKENSPDRNEIAKIYTYLKKNRGFCYKIDYLYYLALRLDINYFKLRLILDILHELDLIQILPNLDGIIFNENKTRVELTNSDTFKLLL